jgi:hypothetical protein
MNWSWIVINTTQLLNIIGIAFDICGAYFVAYEVVRQFKGQQFRRGVGTSIGDGNVTTPAPKPTEEFKNWEARKKRNMAIGLGLLTFGFLLQILGNILQLKPSWLI